MEYRTLGQTGLMVSSICLGTVYFGTQVDLSQSIAIVHAALDWGVNFIDTAEIYVRPAYGTSEEAVGQALVGRRDDVILATKKRYDPGAFRTGGFRDHGLSRRQIFTAIEGSLRRLRTDYIDLYYAHQPDPEVPLEATLRAFEDLVRSGKVRYVALSNHAAWQIPHALWISDRYRLGPLAAVQFLYNLLDRRAEHDLIPASQHFGLGLVAYSPLAGGVLTGKYRSGAEIPADSRAARVGAAAKGRPGHIPVLSPDNLERADRLVELAAKWNQTPSRLAIAWNLHQTGITSTIMGATTTRQLEDNVGSAHLRLASEQLDSLAKI